MRRTLPPFAMRGYLPLAKAARLMPLFLIETAAKTLFVNALAARPRFAVRLAEYGARVFAIDPLDCPFAFLIVPGLAKLRAVRDLEGVTYDARIAAPLLVLLGLIDGTYDGDALFFSRDLVIEGDTEAVLALRNAVEDAELDPAGVLGLPQSVRAPVDRAADFVLARLRRAVDAPADSGPKAWAR